MTMKHHDLSNFWGVFICLIYRLILRKFLAQRRGGLFIFFIIFFSLEKKMLTAFTGEET